jgi:hypothetical protein
MIVRHLLTTPIQIMATIAFDVDSDADARHVNNRIFNKPKTSQA